MDPTKTVTKRNSVHVLQSSNCCCDQKIIFLHTLWRVSILSLKENKHIFHFFIVQVSFLPCHGSLRVDHVPMGMAGFGLWTRRCFGIQLQRGGWYGTCGAVFPQPAQCGSHPQHSWGSPAHPHKVEVNKSDTESSHVDALYRRPRYSHVPVSMFLLSMLILASDCLHSSEELAKLKHQAKVCLLIFLASYSMGQILPMVQCGEVFSLGSC